MRKGERKCKNCGTVIDPTGQFEARSLGNFNFQKHGLHRCVEVLKRRVENLRRQVRNLRDERILNAAFGRK